MSLPPSEEILNIFKHMEATMIDICINVYTVERLLNCQAFASDSIKETLS